ncbi:MAG: type II toxin-antitoxin system HicB family antitoxin [Thermodesulfobacteriota bacterium]
MKIYSYTVLYEPLDEGGYNVIVPAIPEICTFGETLEEAREMAKDAIRCYLESAIKTGEPIPKDVKPREEQVKVGLELFP